MTIAYLQAFLANKTLSVLLSVSREREEEICSFWFNPSLNELGDKHCIYTKFLIKISCQTTFLKLIEYFFYERELYQCAGDCVLAQIVQWGSGNFFTGDIQEPSRHNPMPCGLEWTCCGSHGKQQIWLHTQLVLLYDNQIPVLWHANGIGSYVPSYFLF